MRVFVCAASCSAHIPSQQLFIEATCNRATSSHKATGTWNTSPASRLLDRGFVVLECVYVLVEHLMHDREHQSVHAGHDELLTLRFSDMLSETVCLLPPLLREILDILQQK